MITNALTRKLVLGIGIPAALASGAIAAMASSNDSPQRSDRATTTITQTAPGTTEVVSVREPGEDIRGNADEAELRGRANEPGEDIRGNADEAEHQGGARAEDGVHHHRGHSGPGGGDDSNSGPGGGGDDSSGHGGRGSDD